MRILHLPHNVGGFPYGLAEGERRLGHESRVLNLSRSRYGYAADYVLDIDRRNRLGRWLAYGGALARFRRGFDLYHFNFGSSLLHFPNRKLDLLDLPFYDSRARKVFTYQGCDARQKYPTMERHTAQGDELAACFEEDCYGGACNSGVRDTQRRRAIDKAARHADHMFAVNPDLLHFLPEGKSSFLPYAMSEFETLERRREPFFADGRVHIVHMPTQRGAKGTRYVLAALDKLKDEFGDCLEVNLVENVPHDQALAALAAADLVVDQVLVGWYGGLAVEAMKMGIPVVCFINDRDLGFIPAEMAGEIPIIRANPFDLFDVLRDFMNQRDLIGELSDRSHAYVMRWHRPSEVAKRVFRTVFGTETP